MDTTIVHGGIDFGEGPRWYEGALWFSDFYQHVVRRWQLDGEVTVEATVSGQPSGLGWLPDGRLLVVSMTDRSVLRREADGTLVQHADLSSIATFHCNDITNIEVSLCCAVTSERIDCNGFRTIGGVKII